ncbi:MAG: hypothetical protein JSS29_05045 [Proteobacteria bacterium]|nr:hypothetical protein [Pseudomonadota bacterium]
MRNLLRNATAALAIVLALAACGSSGKEAASNTAQAAARTRKLSPEEQLKRSLVAGVTQTKAGTAAQPIQVQFSVQGKPDVAQPVEVVLAITPTSGNLDRIFGRVEGDEGLEMVGSGDLEEVAKPVENTPIHHTVKVLPKKDGIYTLTATVSVDAAGQVSTQSYLFPLIAGKGMPDLPVAPVPGAKPATPPATAQGPAPAAAAR